LLTNLKVKRFLKTKTGRLHRLTLHDRITALPKKRENVKEKLLALKWLGHAGSHPGEALSRDDVLDMYEVLEYVLVEIYSSPHKKVERLTRTINRRKGPRKRAAK